MEERGSRGQWRVQYHRTHDDESPFKDFIDNLKEGDRVRAFRAMRILRRHGLDTKAAIDDSHGEIRKIEEVRDGLWQMQVEPKSKVRDAINIFYCHDKEYILEMLHGVKGRVTKRDLDIAESYMKN